MRKIKYLLYLLVLAFILVGCSQANMSGSGLENAPNNSTVETTRKIYYTVKYVITSTKCDEIKKNIEIEVKEYNGYISFSNENNDYKEVTYRIPTEKLDEFLDFIDSNGKAVTSKSIESKDITSSYSALEARKQVLEASRNAYVEMLSKPNITMSDIISLQNKIDEIDIELLTIYNELSNYDNLLDYSKVTIIYELQNKDNFFVNYGNYLVVLFITLGKVILYLLPFGLIIGCIIGIIIFVEKKYKKKKN